jgi:hypothetical protein
MSMKNFADVNIELDDRFDEYEIETCAVSPIAPEVGIVVASKRDEHYFVVTLLNMKQEETMKYSVEGEVATFNFTSEEQQREFIDYLPDMSAIDLILLLSSSPTMAYN